MPRIALKLEYAGQGFCGSQAQQGVRTVQQDVEQALLMFLRAPQRVPLTLSGRTDSGVHASGQVAHFDWPDAMDLWRLAWGLNGILKDDLSIANAQIVADQFHSRFSAIKRIYCYRILNRPQRSALLKPTHHFVPLPLNLDAIAKAAQQLVGTHDFAGFKSSNADTSTSVCQVERAQLLNLGEGKLEFWISADHFVYNMVRIIVGTLIEIGLGKRPASDLAEALHQKQRSIAGPTAPAWGLCLESVAYSDQYQLFKTAPFQERVV